MWTYKEREEVYDQVALVLVLYLIGWASGARFLTNQSILMENESKEASVVYVQYLPVSLDPRGFGPAI